MTGTTLIIQNLEEEVTYTFTVRAQTIDYGPQVSGNVTTGPQQGSPVAPRDLILIKTVSSVDMHWMNGPSGRGPILGYYIECKKRGMCVFLSFVAKVDKGEWGRFLNISFSSLIFFHAAVERGDPAYICKYFGMFLVLCSFTSFTLNVFTHILLWWLVGNNSITFFLSPTTTIKQTKVHQVPRN